MKLCTLCGRPVASHGAHAAIVPGQAGQESKNLSRPARTVKKTRRLQRRMRRAFLASRLGGTIRSRTAEPKCDHETELVEQIPQPTPEAQLPPPAPVSDPCTCENPEPQPPPPSVPVPQTAEPAPTVEQTAQTPPPAPSLEITPEPESTSVAQVCVEPATSRGTTVMAIRTRDVTRSADIQASRNVDQGVTVSRMVEHRSDSHQVVNIECRVQVMTETAWLVRQEIESGRQAPPIPIMALEPIESTDAPDQASAVPSADLPDSQPEFNADPAPEAMRSEPASEAASTATTQESPAQVEHAKIEAEPAVETVLEARHQNHHGANHAGPPASGSCPRRKVLVVDDDPVIRMLLKIGLASHGFDCLTAEDGKAAQTLLLSGSFDLMVVDLLMPVMDGLTFIRWLRQTVQDTTPVLVFTNVNDPKVALEARACGANLLVPKPLHLQKIIEALNTLLVPA